MGAYRLRAVPRRASDRQPPSLQLLPKERDGTLTRLDLRFGPQAGHVTDPLEINYGDWLAEGASGPFILARLLHGISGSAVPCNISSGASRPATTSCVLAGAGVRAGRCAGASATTACTLAPVRQPTRRHGHRERSRTTRHGQPVHQAGS
jgi:hypothetical protein